MNASTVTDHLLTSYAEEIEEVLIGLDDPVCRDMMGYAINHLELLRNLKQAPYGLTGSMTYRGGLLVHTVSALRFALSACMQARELETPFSKSLVVAGCVLRNVGWYTTTDFDGNTPQARDSFYTIGVRRASAHYINRLVLECKTNTTVIFPAAKQQVLENMCNTKDDICTFEGKIVSCADNMADVIDFGVDTLRRKPQDNWNDEFFTGHLS